MNGWGDEQFHALTSLRAPVSSGQIPKSQNTGSKNVTLKKKYS